MDEDKRISYFCLGLGIGVAVGILFAPKAGEETRLLLRSKADESKDYVKRKGEELKSSATDLADHWKRLLVDPDALAIRRTLVDLRNCELAFSGEQLFNLVRTLVEPALNGRDWRSALLVGGSVHFGVSRQYQSFAEMYSKDAIFHDEDAALKWLRR